MGKVIGLCKAVAFSGITSFKRSAIWFGKQEGEKGINLLSYRTSFITLPRVQGRCPGRFKGVMVVAGVSELSASSGRIKRSE